MKIKEISKNYDITPHTLRYYEKIGLLSPNYSENGYRDYSFEEIQKLNVIRDLRFFDIPLDEIKNYLETKNTALTKDILEFESQQLIQQINKLKLNQHLLKERIDLINYAELKKNHEIQIVYYDERYIALSKEKNTPGKNLYFELKQLHKQFETELYANNQNVFGTILVPQDGVLTFQVFYCLENALLEKESSILPAGSYVSIYYTGTYKNRSAALKELNNYLERNQLETIGPYYEFYLIDFHETNISTEYVSKIEIQLNL
ncbi:MerR family transcriptional regulator [Lactococcus garvieae]|uniref:MerR family transcriptional regulator n=1 Tax=Lactococcus garvieae TaxID=1363 RepID=UPI0009BEE776|nr:MerR family transcriptional regulator [Lactococcus garvieae]